MKTRLLKDQGKCHQKMKWQGKLQKGNLCLPQKKKNQTNKGQSFQSETNCYKKNVYKEESRDKEVEEDVEEYIKKKKQRKRPKKSKKEESRCDDEESSADEKPKTKKQIKKATIYHKNNLKSQNTLGD